MFVLFVFVSSAFLSWSAVFFLLPQLQHRLLDIPNSRSSHRQPVPRGGGTAFFAVASISSVIELLTSQGSSVAALPLLAAPLAFVGLLDDRLNLPASCRYGFQLFTAALILGFSDSVKVLMPEVISSNLIFLIAISLLVLAVTAVINFINFMDGLDGMVAGCMVVAITALTLSLNSSWSLWSLVGSLVGFLFWNWSPAKVFMGDVGSTFLGAIFAGLVLQTPNLWDSFGYLLVATPLLADAFFCVLRRLLAGQQVFKAHRLHLFQRLNQAGWPHSRVSFIYIAATTVLSLALLIGGLFWVFGLSLVVMCLGVQLDKRFAVPFAVASKS